MRYRIEYKQNNAWEVLHDSDWFNSIVVSATLIEEVNSIARAVIQVAGVELPIQAMETLIRIRENNSVIFMGRVCSVKKAMFGITTYEVESVLSFLCDTVVEPFRVYSVTADNVVKKMLTEILKQFNNRMFTGRRITLAECNVRVEPESVMENTTVYTNTWEFITKRIIEKAGGYLYLTYGTDDSIHLHYVSEFAEVNPYPVYSENLLEYNHETDHSETYTAMLPLGNDNLTIMGLSSSTSHISGIYLFDPVLQAKYGWIVYQAEYETDDAETLLRLAEADFLRIKNQMHHTISLSAVCPDFNTRYHIGQNIRVRWDNTVVDYPLTQCTTDLLNPENNKITLGTIESTLTDSVKSAGNAVGSGITNSPEWIPLELSSDINVGNYSRTTPSYTKINGHVYISGSIVPDTAVTSAVVVATLPEAYRPTVNQYRIVSCGGKRIARLVVSPAGNIVIDWLINIVDGTNHDGTVWIDITIDYFID